MAGVSTKSESFPATLRGAEDAYGSARSEAPQVMQIRLHESVFKDIISSIHSSHPAHVVFGSSPALEVGDRTIPLLSIPDRFPNEVYKFANEDPRSWTFQGLQSHTLSALAKKKSDPSLEALKNSLAQADLEKKAKSTLRVDVTKDRLTGSRTLTARPAGASLAVPPITPASTPILVSTRDARRKNMMAGIRHVIIHLLAAKGPMSAAQLRTTLAIPENADTDFLMNPLKAVAMPTKPGSEAPWKLKDKSYRELNVFKFSYESPEVREQAIEHAIKAYDRMRVNVEDSVWQLLLPEEERGKGKILSRLHFHLTNTEPPPPSSARPNIDKNTGLPRQVKKKPTPEKEKEKDAKSPVMPAAKRPAAVDDSRPSSSSSQTRSKRPTEANTKSQKADVPKSKPETAKPTERVESSTLRPDAAKTRAEPAKSRTEKMTKPEPKADPKAQPQTKADPKPKVETKPKAEPKSKVESRAEPKARVESKTEPKSRVEFKNEPKSRVESKNEPKSRVESRVEPKSKLDSKAKVEPKPKPKSPISPPVATISPFLHKTTVVKRIMVSTVKNKNGDVTTSSVKVSPEPPKPAKPPAKVVAKKTATRAERSPPPSPRATSKATGKAFGGRTLDRTGAGVTKSQSVKVSATSSTPAIKLSPPPRRRDEPLKGLATKASKKRERSPSPLPREPVKKSASGLKRKSEALEPSPRAPKHRRSEPDSARSPRPIKSSAQVSNKRATAEVIARKAPAAVRSPRSSSPRSSPVNSSGPFSKGITTSSMSSSVSSDDTNSRDDHRSRTVDRAEVFKTMYDEYKLLFSRTWAQKRPPPAEVKRLNEMEAAVQRVKDEIWSAARGYTSNSARRGRK